MQFLVGVSQGVAQPSSARARGARGRGCESHRPDMRTDIHAYLPGEDDPTDLDGYAERVMTQFVVDHLANRDSPNRPDQFEFDPGGAPRHDFN